MSDKFKKGDGGGLLPHVRKLYDEGQADALWQWCMDGEGALQKAKRFAVCERFAEKMRDASSHNEREVWGNRRKVYARWRVRYSKLADRVDDQAKLPAQVHVYEMLYHNPPHLHVALVYAELLQVCEWAEDHGMRVGEFPPFDTVENVHVDPGSFHTRDKNSPSTARYFADFARLGLSGLAADINDLDGGNDQEYALFLTLQDRRA